MTKAKYVELLERFPPRVIREEEQLEATERAIDALLERKEELDEDELAYLDLLTQLVENWEDDNVDMPMVGGVDLLKVLMDDRGLTQRDLVRAGVFATDSVASEVLSGKRGLTLEHVVKLARYFDLRADLFLPAAAQVSLSPTSLPRTGERRP